MDSRRLFLIRILFWIALTLSLVFALLPQPPEIPGPTNDKVQHILAFLTLGGLGSFAYPKSNPVYLGAGLSLFGGLVEVLQAIPALHRDADPVDWMADTAAAALIIIFLRWLTARLSRTAREEG